MAAHECRGIDSNTVAPHPIRAILYAFAAVGRASKIRTGAATTTGGSVGMRRQNPGRFQITVLGRAEPQGEAEQDSKKLAGGKHWRAPCVPLFKCQPRANFKTSPCVESRGRDIRPGQKSARRAASSGSRCKEGVVGGGRYLRCVDCSRQCESMRQSPGASGHRTLLRVAPPF